MDFCLYLIFSLSICTSHFCYTTAELINTTEINVFQMLRFWRNRSGTDLTVEKFVAKLYTWQRAAYISPDVWETIRKFVDNDVISQNTPGMCSLFTLVGSESDMRDIISCFLPFLVFSRQPNLTDLSYLTDSKCNF